MRAKGNKDTAKTRRDDISRERRERARQMGPLLELDSNQEWTSVSGIFDAFPNMPCNIIVLNPTDTQPYLAKH